MADDVGPFRTGAEARARPRRDRRLARDARRAPVRRSRAVRHARASTGSTCATCCWWRATVARAALRAHREPRRPSARGFSRMLPEWRVNQVVRWHDGDIASQLSSAERRARRRRRAMTRAPPRIENLARQRGDGGDFETYDVPFEPGQSVLDGLRWIRAHRDPTLAIRFSCINANACKECMMEIDGARLRLHRPPRAARDDGEAAVEQGAGARSGHRDRAAGGAVSGLVSGPVRSVTPCRRLGPLLSLPAFGEGRVGFFFPCSLRSRTPPRPPRRRGGTRAPHQIALNAGRTRLI